MKVCGTALHAEINADPCHGGPYIDREDNGSVSIAYYGKPGGRVQITLTDSELAELQQALDDSKERTA